MNGHALTPQVYEMRKFQLQQSCSLIHIKKGAKLMSIFIFAQSFVIILGSVQPP